jgi:replicative DNA helicase
MNGKVILETVVDEEAERGLLGCCLLDCVTKVSEIFDELGPEAVEVFSHPHHRAVWMALVDVISDGKEPDLLKLSMLLKKGEYGDTPPEGWIGLLTVLQDSVPSAENMPYYFTAARDAMLRRKAGRFLTELYEKLGSQSGKTKRLLEEAEGQLMAINAETSSKLIRLPTEFEPTLNLVNAYSRGETQLLGLPTGYKFLDRKMGGLVGGDLIVIGGRPGSGKTVIGMNIAVNQVIRNPPSPVMVFSMEMSARELGSRVLFSQTKSNMVKFRTGYVDDKDIPNLLAKAKELEGIPLWVDERPGLGIEQVRSKARQVKLLHGIELIVVDYLQLSTGLDKKRYFSRQDEVADISKGLKAMAKELDVPVLALAQLNRNSAKSKYDAPNLADLRESGQIEQDADFVGLLHEIVSKEKDPNPPRPGSKEYYTKKTDLIIAKQRSGPTGVVHFDFERWCATFVSDDFENKEAQDEEEQIIKDGDWGKI